MGINLCCGTESKTDSYSNPTVTAPISEISANVQNEELEIVATRIKEVNRGTFTGEIDFSQYIRAIEDPDGENKYILEHKEDHQQNK